jgi:hypothetical protein
MKMIFLISLLISTHIVLAQNKEWISLYAGINNSVTVEDITRQNNPWGTGVFTSAYANTGGWLRPTIEITAEGFIKDKEVMVYDGFDGVLPRIDAMISLMGGAAIRIERFLSIGFVTGPAFLSSDDTRTAFITNKRLWVIKPNIDITPGKGKLTFRIGYVKGSSRFKTTSPTRYRALTAGVGFRLIGK